MELYARDFYQLFCQCNNNIKKVNENIRDGYCGMYFVLRILDEAKTGLTAGDISARIGTTTARTAAILSNLENKGLLSRQKAADDARKTIVTITPRGEKILQKRKAKLFAEMESFLGVLDTAEKSQFYHILKKLLNQ